MIHPNLAQLMNRRDRLREELNQVERMLDGVDARLCRKCRKWKPVADFYCNQSYADGHSTQCKRCLKEKQKEWKKENSHYLKMYRAAKEKE